MRIKVRDINNEAVPYASILISIDKLPSWWIFNKTDIWGCIDKNWEFIYQDIDLKKIWVRVRKGWFMPFEKYIKIKKKWCDITIILEKELDHYLLEGKL